jgi:epoxyqueuosine reductase
MKPKGLFAELFLDLGVCDFGYTEEFIPSTVDHYKTWVDKDQHLPLTYLEGERFEKRLDIREFWPEFQSAIVFLFSYDSKRQSLQHFYKKDKSWNGLKIASYTLGFEGLDYHHEIKARLETIGEKLKSEYQLDYKLTLDVHPVLERDLAFRSGIGWFGKNSMLINRKEGSFTLIGSLLLNKKIESLSKKSFETDHCGQCTRCIDACPTQAIDPATRTIIAQDCISTFTIEQFKLETPVPEKMNLTSGFVFGCDICQDVCPWNTRLERTRTTLSEWNAKQQEIMDFYLKRPINELSEDLEAMSGKTFEKRFRQTSFERSGRRGLLKNLRLYLTQKS